jgi:hypothetical protein
MRLLASAGRPPQRRPHFHSPSLVGRLHKLVTGRLMPSCQQKLDIQEQLERLSQEQALIMKEELDGVLTGAASAELHLRLQNALIMRALVLDQLRTHMNEHGC